MVSAGLHAVPQSRVSVSGALVLAAPQRAVSGGEMSEPFSPPPTEVPPLQAVPVGHCGCGQSPGPERGGGPDAPVVPQRATRPLLPSLGNHLELPINPTMAAVVLHHRLQASVASKDHG